LFCSSFAAFSEPRVAALSDGRLLLAGKLRGRPAARIIDPGRGKVSVRGLEREVARLVAREDGSVVELGAEGAGISREDARTQAGEGK